MATTTFEEEFQHSWLTSLFGFLVFCGGICLLTWNEGRALHYQYSLEETHGSTISLNSFETLQPEYDNRVVHIAGNLVIDEPLTEPEYGISIQAVKLKRIVEMYQWVEERTAVSPGESPLPGSDSNNDNAMQGTDTHYSYVIQWREELVDSSSFYIRHGHENPSKIPRKTVTYIAPNVKIGPLNVSLELKDKFSDFSEVTSNEDERSDRNDIKLHLGIYYHCQDVFNPEVGDIRVQFYYAGLADNPVTIVAKQENGVLVPYTTSQGKKVALLRNGNLDISEMFSAEHWDARVETWKYRFYGGVLIYFATIFWPRLFSILFNRLPYLGNITFGEATDLKNYLVAGFVALFIIALSWIFYRPVFCTSLIFAAICQRLYTILWAYLIPTQNVITS